MFKIKLLNHLKVNNNIYNFVKAFNFGLNIIFLLFLIVDYLQYNSVTNSLKSPIKMIFVEKNYK